MQFKRALGAFTAPVVAVALAFPTAASAKVETPDVQLISAGKGKKTALRLDLKKGTAHTVQMSMAIEMAMAMGGMKMPPMKAPITKLDMVTRITDVKKDRVRYTFEIANARIDATAGAPPMQVDMMKKSMSQMNGIKGWVEIDRRGRTLAADFSIDKTTDPNLQQLLQNVRQSINQLSAPLPKAPVGVGAKWKVVTSLDSMGFPLKQTVTYELLELKGNVGKLRMEIEQKTTSSEVALPNLPAGTKASLKKMDSKGGGTVQFDLRAVAPTKADSKLSTSMETEIEAQGKTQVMGMDMSMRMELTRR